MLYSIGDAVKIRDNLTCSGVYPMADGSNAAGTTGEMTRLRGRTATVTGFTQSGRYRIDLDDGFWSWTDKMFQGPAPADSGDFPASDMPIETLFRVWKGVIAWYCITKSPSPSRGRPNISKGGAAMGAKIHVPPTEVWQFFAKNRKRLKDETVLVAENKDTKYAVYLTEEKGLPLFEVYRGDQKLCEESAVSQDDSTAVAKRLYVKYLLPVSVDGGGERFDDVPEDPEEDEPRPKTRQEIEDEMYERDDELLQATYDYLETVLGTPRESVDDLMGSDVADFLDRVCEILAMDFGVSVYRPMYLINDDTGGEYYEEYPYSEM